MYPLWCWLLGLLTAAAIAQTLLAARAVARLGRGVAAPVAPEPVTLLKPLHGAEPRLAANLATFRAQDWAAPVQIVAGVASPNDPALAAARAVGATLAIDATRHGASGKVSNLVNMMAHAEHELLVLSDSDMAVPPAYLATIAGALAAPGVGAVTCYYRGRGDAGGWSRLAAAGISYQFLPAVALGVALRLATPCMGSTIALRRKTLEAIGGFGRFADRLADDYEIGAAVRAQGLSVALPPLILVHGCAETSLAAIWRHERRWQGTIRLLDPIGHAGAIATHPLPLALILLAGAPRAGLALLLAALGARLVLKGAVDRVAGATTAPGYWLPVRDCLSFAVFIASFVVRSVDWRGERLRMAGKGAIASTTETSPT